MRRWSAGGLVLLVSLTGSDCDVDLGVRPKPAARSFGEIVYTEVCERVAYSAELAEVQAGQRPALDSAGVAYRSMCRGGQPPPAGSPPVLTAVHANRKTIIEEVNAGLPEGILTPLDLTLRRSLPALDGAAGRLSVLRTGELLVSTATEARAKGSYAKLAWQDGFVPAGTTQQMLLWALTRPSLQGALRETTRVLAQPVATGDKPLTALLQGIAGALAQPEQVKNPLAADRTLRVALDLLLSNQAELRTLPPGQTQWMVLRDGRGVADVNKVGGLLPAGFVDKNGDGRADLDDLLHFVGPTGETRLDVTPFRLLDRARVDAAVARDAEGRALVSAGGAPLYRYQNLDDTVLAALLREGGGLTQPQRDIPFRVSKGMQWLMGPRMPQRKEYPNGSALAYVGFDTSPNQAPMLDLLHAYVQLLGYSDRGDATGTDLSRLLRGVSLLMRDQESAMARSLHAVMQALDEGKKPAYSDAVLPDSSTVFDDLAPILVRLLRQPGLVPDLLDALRNPATGDLAELLALLMNDSGYFFMNQAQLDATKPGAVTGALGKRVNRGAVDQDIDYVTSNVVNNRSIMQRVLHLVHDANGHQFCNKAGAKVSQPIPLPGTYAPCDLLKIDDLALFYLLSMTSRPVKDTLPEADFLNAIQSDGLRTAMRLGGALFLSNMLGIPGFDFVTISIIPPKNAVYPSPEAASRLLFQDRAGRTAFQQDALDLGACSPRRPGTLCCNQNHDWQQHHNGVLFALESVRSKNGRNFYQAISPVVDVFAKRTECLARDAGGTCTKSQNAAKILLDLLSVLHRHWPSDKSQFYGLNLEAESKKSAIKTYEPLIAALLSQGDLWPSVLALAPVLLNTRVDDGSNLQVAALLERFGVWFLDPEAARMGGKLTNRDGVSAAVRADGQPTFKPTGDMVIRDVLSTAGQGRMTPYDLLSDALKKKRSRLRGEASTEAAWQGGMSELADLMLLARPTGTGAYAFQNPRIRGVSMATVEFLRKRVQAHGLAGDLGAWVQQGLFQDVSGALAGPVGAGVLDVLGSLDKDPTAKQQLGLLLSELLSDPGGMAQDAPKYRALVAVSADLLQRLLDDETLVPMYGPLATWVAPQTGGAEPLVEVLSKALPGDPDQVMLEVARNFLRADVTGLYPAYRLSNVMSAVHRPQPSPADAPLSGTDEQAILRGMGAFLVDPLRGAVRLVDIVQARNLTQPE